MPLKTVLFLALFAVCSVGALFMPSLGVFGYAAHYSIGPERQWWSAPVEHLGLRYSFTLAVMTAVGMALNWGKLRFGRKALTSQEILMLLLLGVIWMSVAIGMPAAREYQAVDHPAVKATKLLIFVLMLTHIVTDVKTLTRLFWVLTAGALVLGLQSYTAPASAFVQGRLDDIGGPDFNNSNRLAGYLGAMLFIIGSQFMRAKWWGKVLGFVAGGLAANAIVLTRTRGALLGLATGGLVAVLMAPKRFRWKILIGLVAAGLGFLYLSDPNFIERMSTLFSSEQELDASATNRFAIWRATVEMVQEHPLGVGAGNFMQAIGRYSPEHAGLDAHSTFFRCMGELGVPGLLLLLLLIGNAVRTLRHAMKQAETLPEPDRGNLLWLSYGTATALAAIVGYGATGSLVYTEYFWWFLAFPTCLLRAIENVAEAPSHASVPAASGQRAAPAPAAAGA